MRIIFLGDSLTWGGYGGDFVAEVAKLLPQHEILNAGMGGDTVVNLLERLDEDVLSKQPDGVFVLIGGNDAISSCQPETKHYYRRRKGAPEGVMTLDLFTQTYRGLLTRIQAAQIHAWVALPVMEYNPATVAATRGFNAAAADVARTLNIPVLDLMDKFPPGNVPDRPPLSMDYIRQIGHREQSGWDDYEAERERGGFRYTFDGLHLTPDTAAKLAQVIVTFLDL
jgi:lysophospholipase L1-like esterase